MWLAAAWVVFSTRWLAAALWCAVMVASIIGARRIVPIMRPFLAAQAAVASAWMVLFTWLALQGGPPTELHIALTRVGHYFIAVLLLYHTWLLTRVAKRPGRDK